MSRDPLVLRTVYVDDLVDRALTIQAQAIGVSKGTLFRRWLDVGVRAVREGRRSLEPLPAPAAPLILKTVGLSAKLDQLLRVQAFDEHCLQSEVTRRYLQVGLELSQGG